MRLGCECRFAPFSATPRLSVRHAADTIEGGELWRESFGPAAFSTALNPIINLKHDGPGIGPVVSVIPHGRWWLADFIVDVDDEDAQIHAVREHVKVGAGVSPGFCSLRREENEDVHVVRHSVCLLKEITIFPAGKRTYAGYLEAEVTRVHELPERKASPAAAPTSELAAGEIIHPRGGLLRRDCGTILGIR